MPVALGSSSIEKMYLGETEIKKAYLGSTEVFSSAAPPSLIMYSRNDNQDIAQRISEIKSINVDTLIIGPAERIISGAWSSVLASHNRLLYIALSNNLYSINTTTGETTRISTTSKSYRGLTSHNGFLLGLDISSGLFIVNTTTGNHTRVNLTRPSGVFGPHLIESHNGILYGTFSNVLYTINTTTGISTRVGSASRFGVNVTSPIRLVSHRGVLYMIDRSSNIYSLNTDTGVATLIGQLNGIRSSIASHALDPLPQSYRAPNAPSNVRVSGTNLSWNASTDLGFPAITGYDVFYRDGGNTRRYKFVEGTSTSLVITQGLITGFIRVCAINVSGVASASVS